MILVVLVLSIVVRENTKIKKKKNKGEEGDSGIDSNTM
jgi:hypothetical protein